MLLVLVCGFSVISSDVISFTGGISWNSFTANIKSVFYEWNSCSKWIELSFCFLKKISHSSHAELLVVIEVALAHATVVIIVADFDARAPVGFVCVQATIFSRMRALWVDGKDIRYFISLGVRHGCFVRSTFGQRSYCFWWQFSRDWLCLRYYRLGRQT